MSFTANANGPRGFDPVKAKSGTPNRMRTARILGTYATALYTGQPVAVHTDGYLIVLADDANVVAGVFAGCEYVTAAGDTIFSPYWPAPGAVKTGTVPKANYYPADEGLFLIHADETLAQLDVGDYFALTTTVGTGGSALTGRSSAEVDASSGNAAAVGLLVQCVEINAREEATDLSAASIMTVQFVRPQFGGKIDGATS